MRRWVYKLCRDYIRWRQGRHTQKRLRVKRKGERMQAQIQRLQAKINGD